MRSPVRDSAAVALKELRQLGRDPVSLALTFVFPILLVGIFILIFAASFAGSYSIPVAVADLDSSPISKILVDKMAGSSVIHVTQFAQTEEQTLGAVQSGDVAGAVIIPRGFSDALLKYGQAFVLLRADNSRQRSAALIQTALNTEAQELVKTAGPEQTSVEVIFRPISGRAPSGDPILAGMLGMITMLGAFDDVVNAISRERERGTFPRLALTPASIFSIYSGKILATVLLTMVRTSLMLVIFSLMGLVMRGSILLVYLTTSLIGIFTLSVGLVASSRIRSSTTLTVFEIALAFPLFFFTGATRSPQLLASGARAITRILPWAYGNEALRRVIYLGLGFDAIAADLAILFLSGIVLLPVATVLSKRTM